jgi:hypothetical protein
MSSKYFYSSTKIRQKLTWFENLLTTILDASVSYLERAQCKRYGYKLEGKGIAHEHTYYCEGNTKNQEKGYCILPMPDALEQCNQDPDCGGFEITDHTAWRHTYDRNRIPSVQLLKRGSKIIHNADWTSFLKDDSNWTLINRKYTMLTCTFNF